jgi:hypothetical protein
MFECALFSKIYFLCQRPHAGRRVGTAGADLIRSVTRTLKHFTVLKRLFCVRQAQGGEAGREATDWKVARSHADPGNTGGTPI